MYGIKSSKCSMVKLLEPNINVIIFFRVSISCVETTIGPQLSSGVQIRYDDGDDGDGDDDDGDDGDGLI